MIFQFIIQLYIVKKFDKHLTIIQAPQESQVVHITVFISVCIFLLERHTVENLFGRIYKISHIPLSEK